MSDDNVRSLSAIRADRENDNRLITPLEALEELAREIRAGEVDPINIAIAFRTRTDPDFFDFRYRLSNLRVSEAVTLLTAVHARMVKTLIGDA